MKEKDTPLKLIRSWPKAAPGCYEELDYLLGAKADGEAWWSDYCMLPIAAAYTYLLNIFPKKKSAAKGAELTACWMWRKDKIIYSFDAELIRTLADQVDQVDDLTDTDVLPVDLLFHLPYPCIYLKTPRLHEHVDGCFVWIEYDLERKSPEFRVQVVLEGYEDSIPMVMHLIQSGTIHDCIQDTLKATRENVNYDIPDEAYTDTARTILTVIQLILYLNAENADVVDVPPPSNLQEETAIPLSWYKTKPAKSRSRTWASESAPL